MKIYIIIATALIIILYAENNILAVTRLQYTSERLPEGFDGYRIVHLSDLHGKVFGANNRVLVSAVNDACPDIIVITGDLIDADYFNESSILNLADSLKQIAPVYYVTGNHEAASKGFKSLAQKLRKNGIKILRNSGDTIKRGNDSINIMGVDDPITTSMRENAFTFKYLSDELNQVLAGINASAFKILLTHRPEQFSLYAEKNIDLIFAGHAHGGQVRLPFIGGLAAPGQGFFPKYTSGKYSTRNSTMIVSRGLGNGSIPQRFLNRPEIIITTLNKK